MNQEPVFKNFCAPRANNVAGAPHFRAGRFGGGNFREISGGICRGHNPRRHQGRSQPGLRDSYNRVHSRLGADTCVAELPAPSSAKVSTRERRTMRAPDGARSPEPKPERRMTRARARDDQGASEPALETSDPTRPAASVPLPRDGHEDAAPDGHEDAAPAKKRNKVPTLKLKEGAKTCNRLASSVPTRAWMPLIEDNFTLDGTSSVRRGSAGASGTSIPGSDESVVGARGGPPTPNSSRALRRVASDTQGGVDSGTYKVVSDLLERKSGEHADTEAKAAASDEKLRELRAQVDGLQRQLEDEKRRNAVLQRDFDELCFGCYRPVKR